jgi:hypothetical protein
MTMAQRLQQRKQMSYLTVLCSIHAVRRLVPIVNAACKTGLA